MENVNWDQLFYYEDLLAYGKYLANHYPEYISLEMMGQSLDKRDIFFIKAGRGNQNIILTAGVHGRESVNPMVLLSMAEFYCENRMTYLSAVTLYIVPLVNPDGYTVALLGFDKLKNEQVRNEAKGKNLSYLEWKENGRGVDLNRNFPASSWKKKDENDYPGSEPETVALMNLMKEVPSIGYIDYHSRGKEVYYYRKAMSEAYNKEQRRFADIICTLTGYSLAVSSREIDSGDSGGNTVHYYSEIIKKPAITIETIEEEAIFPLSSHYQQVVFDEIKMTPFVFLR